MLQFEVSPLQGLGSIEHVPPNASLVTMSSAPPPSFTSFVAVLHLAENVGKPW